MLRTLKSNGLLLFSLGYGTFVLLPFLAPQFMAWGWEQPARFIYALFSFLCHQLPQRSFFLFGPKASYSLLEIQSVWKNTVDPLVLRQFIGSPQMGWKVAWSDRMVSMYSSILPFTWLWVFLRRRLKPLPLWGFLLLLLPMAVDGGTHLVSDFSGIGQGFRDTNQWLLALTGAIFPAKFYAGDALGSFNSWMRLLTGAFFGMAVVWFAAPLLDPTPAPQDAMLAPSRTQVAESKVDR